MKNPMIALIAVAAVAILGVGAFTLSQNSSQSDSMMAKDDASMAPENSMMQKEDDATGDKMMDETISPRYVTYNKSNFDNVASNRRVLFFYASWCPTCKPADADLTENVSKIPSDVTVIRVNYNDPETDQEEKDLAKKYGITYQHTFVQIDSQGNEVTKWNGGKTDELLANIK